MTDISTSSWSETDGSNNQAAPLGAPEGMAPSGVNNTMRAMMGATKRFWDRINPTVTATAVGNAYTWTGSTVPTALAHGEIYSFVCPSPNTGAATLNVGVGGAQQIVKHGASGLVALSSSDFATGTPVMTMWDSVNSYYLLINTPYDTKIATEIASLSAVTTANIRSTSLYITTDIHSISAAIVTDLTNAFNANDDSVSAVIKADISSVSAVLTVAIAGVIPAGSRLFFYNNAAPTGWTFESNNDFTLVTQANVGDGGATGGSWGITGLSTESAAHNHGVTGDTGNQSDNHTHVFSGTTDNSVAVSAGFNFGGAANAAANPHTHTYSGITAGVSTDHHHSMSFFSSNESATHNHTGDGTWRPAHLKVIVCRKN